MLFCLNKELKEPICIVYFKSQTDAKWPSTKNTLKKMFPNLYKELEAGDAKISIDALRKNPEEAEADLAEMRRGRN